MSGLGGIVLDSFLDGLTGAGLFGKLRRPGAPSEFMDSRGVEALYETGEFQANTERFRFTVDADPNPPQTLPAERPELPRGHVARSQPRH